MKLLLFDIDGTLLKGGGVGPRAMEDAGKTLFGETFALQGLDMSGKIDPQIFAELVQLNKHLEVEKHHDQFKARYLQNLEHFLFTDGSPLILPGVLELLQELEPYSRTLGLLTGNYSLAAPLKIKAAKMDMNQFKVNAFGDEGRSRNDLPKVAMNKYKQLTGEDIAGHEVMIIGDTPRDVECAKVNGCYAFAVATGRWSFEELERSGADTVVQDLSNPQALLNLLA